MFKKLVAAISISLILVGACSACNMQKTANDIEVFGKSTQFLL